MKSKATAMRIDHAQLEALRAYTKITGVTMTGALRKALNLWLQTEATAEVEATVQKPALVRLTSVS